MINLLEDPKRETHFLIMWLNPRSCVHESIGSKKSFPWQAWPEVGNINSHPPNLIIPDGYLFSADGGGGHLAGVY